MSPRLRPFALMAGWALLAPFTAAQDSVALTTCSGGDGTFPWDDASATNGSEQADDFVVNLNTFGTRWGVKYGIAPLLKSSKTSAAFNSSLVSAQALSRLQKTGVTTSTMYSEWSAPGFGVNNDPAKNSAGTLVAAPCDMNQFGVAFAEFGTTDAGASYNGVIGASVLYDPANPGRLYVSRKVAATNSSTPAENTGAVALGSVNEEGSVFLRTDGFGATGGAGLTSFPGNNIFSVNMPSRSASALNVLSDDTPGKKDLGALSHYVVNSTTTHGPPTNLPPAVTGGGDHYMGGNFNTQYVHGELGSVTVNTSHLGAGVTDMRGNVSYTQDNFGGTLNSTHGLAAILGIDGVSGASDTLNVWGLNSSGGVTGTLACQMPGAITDNSDGFTTLGPAGTLEFDHYHSQVGFQGGNGQISMRVDQNGDLLIAAVLDHPLDGGTDFPINAIGVCKVDGTTGAESWTLAAWNDGASGKDILDGPGGAPIGNLIPLNVVTGGAPLGPSMSAPMFDAVGNLYFLSAVHTDVDNDDATGLVRAVYDPANFAWELDLVMKTGDIFHGENSDRDYLVTFIGIADGNSVSSGSAWSQNISDVAHGAMDPSGLDTNDSRALGGIVISAGIIYDTNGDGDFTDCVDLGVDEDYNVLLYIGHAGWENKGFAKARANGVEPKLDFYGPGTAGSDFTVELTDLEPGQVFYVIAGFTEAITPFKFGTLYPTPDVILNPLPTLAGEFSLTTAWPAGLPSCFPIHWQAWCSGPSILFNFSATNGVRSVTP